MLNSELVMQAAADFASKMLAKRHGHRATQAMYLLAYGRPRDRRRRWPRNLAFLGRSRSCALSGQNRTPTAASATGLVAFSARQFWPPTSLCTSNDDARLTILPLLSRRAMLSQAAVGFGSLALASLLADESARDVAAVAPIRCPAPKPPHFPPRAKRVIFLFMKGGPSHVDTFDPKPLLDARRRQAAARSPSRACSSPRPATCSTSPWKFQQHGQSGIWVSELFPHVAELRRRPLLHPLGPRHQPGPRRGRAQAAHRQRQLRPPQHRLVGHLRPGHREPQPARRSSPSARRWPTAASTTGARPSCRPSTRARRWATPASRPTRPGSGTSATRSCRARCSGCSSIGWRR